MRLIDSVNVSARDGHEHPPALDAGRGGTYSVTVVTTAENGKEKRPMLTLYEACFCTRQTFGKSGEK